jgi:hypothetical protein
LVQITKYEGDDEMGRFSPDGSKFAFSSKRPNDSEYNGWLINNIEEVFSGLPANITPFTNWSGDDGPDDWSPDGTKLLIGSNMNGNWEIYICDYLCDELAFPSANITYPILNQEVSGQVEIKGTAKDNISVDGKTILSKLSSYSLEYGQGENPNKWNVIITSNTPVDNDILGIWDTTKLDDGIYTIRLTATDTQDINSQKITVRVKNNLLRIANGSFDDYPAETNNISPWRVFGSLQTCILATGQDTVSDGNYLYISSWDQAHTGLSGVESAPIPIPDIEGRIYLHVTRNLVEYDGYGDNYAQIRIGDKVLETSPDASPWNHAQTGWGERLYDISDLKGQTLKIKACVYRARNWARSGEGGKVMLDDVWLVVFKGKQPAISYLKESLPSYETKVCGSLVIISGDKQSNKPGLPLSEPLMVRFIPDQATFTVPSTFQGIVNWKIKEPSYGAFLSISTSTLTPEGFATNTFTLGKKEGEYQILASFGDSPVYCIFTATAIGEELLTPASTEFLQSFPNPAEDGCWIPFKLAEDSEVKIEIYNIVGQKVKTIDVGRRKAGFYTSKNSAIFWDRKNNQGERVASGLYFIRFSTGKFKSTKALILR